MHLIPSEIAPISLPVQFTHYPCNVNRLPEYRKQYRNRGAQVRYFGLAKLETILKTSAAFLVNVISS